MQSNINIRNKKASFNYTFIEKYTAGIKLTGTEIKSIRLGKASLGDAYCIFINGELFIRGLNITLVTTTDKDEEAYELLKAFGMPFRRREDSPEQ